MEIDIFLSSTQYTDKNLNQYCSMNDSSHPWIKIRGRLDIANMITSSASGHKVKRVEYYRRLVIPYTLNRKEYYEKTLFKKKKIKVLFNLLRD